MKPRLTPIEGTEPEPSQARAGTSDSVVFNPPDDGSGTTKPSWHARAAGHSQPHDDGQWVPTWVTDIFGADLRSLAALRIVLAVIVLIDLAGRAPNLLAHYTDYGVLPRHILLITSNMWRFSLNLINGTLFAQALLFGITALAAVALLVGYRTRRGSCSWDVGHVGWVVAPHFPEDQTCCGRTLVARSPNGPRETYPGNSGARLSRPCTIPCAIGSRMVRRRENRGGS